jgi:hypothetical protein
MHTAISGLILATDNCRLNRFGIDPQPARYDIVRVG